MATGGTTGRRGVFVFDRREWSACLAGFLRWSDWCGTRPRLPRLRVASVSATSPLHMTARYGMSIDVGLHRLLRLDARAPLDELCAAIDRFRPDALIGYPSVLALLALEQLEGRLNVAPRTVSTTSEVRTPEMTERIRTAWGAEPFDVYGITEAGIFAVDCEHHAGKHLFEDLAFVEVVDEAGRAVPDGEPGARLLVTNLFNRTLPLIRYELDDLVTLSPEPCPCGRPLRVIAALEGRSDDVLHLPGAAGGTVAVHPHALRSPLARFGEVAQYRVVHDEDGVHVELVLRANASPDTPERVAEALRDALRELGADRLVDARSVERPRARRRPRRQAEARRVAGRLTLRAGSPDQAAAPACSRSSDGSRREMTREMPSSPIETPYRVSAASIVRFWWVTTTNCARSAWRRSRVRKRSMLRSSSAASTSSST